MLIHEEEVVEVHITVLSAAMAEMLQAQRQLMEETALRMGEKGQLGHIGINTDKLAAVEEVAEADIVLPAILVLKVPTEQPQEPPESLMTFP